MSAVDEVPIDFDYPCTGCGYNLRGLCGKVVRCPECGHEQAHVTIVAMRERSRVAEWEDRVSNVSFGANVCAAATTGALLSLWLGVAFDFLWDVVRALAFVLSVIWVVGLVWFVAATRSIRGTRALVFLRHQRWKIPWMLLMVGFLGVAPAAAAAFSALGGGLIPCFAWFAILLVFLTMQSNPIEFLANRARGEIEAFLRATRDR